MTANFDIFRMEANGGVRWLSCAISLTEAEDLLRKFAAQNSGSYFIFDQTTRNRTIVHPCAPLS
jgi:hypothetical protein